ncbi:MAG TPA: hypothetical protein VIH93_01720, partial [Thermoanaerobaculia bacterium]
GRAGQPASQGTEARLETPGGPGAGAPGGRPHGAGAGSAGSGGPGAGRTHQGGGGGSRTGTVYVLADKGKLKPIQVRTSITDGAFTATMTKDLKPGDEVVVGLATAKTGTAAVSRPPTLGGGGGRGPRM